MNNSKKLRNNLLTAAALSGLLSPMTAFAAESAPAAPADTQVDQLIVTGSRVKRTVESSPAPIDVLSNVALDKTSKGNLLESLNTLLPSFNLPNVATPNEVVVTTSFSIELGNNGGDVHICMPYTMIEPIRDRLTSAIQGEALEVDKRWLRLLSQQVQTAEVELIADLATAKVQVSDILNMKVGDVIPLELDDSVTAKVHAVPVMQCNYVTFNGQYALRVNRMLNMSGSEPATESDDDN